jgi:PST family polysaccharide transporter
MRLSRSYTSKAIIVTEHNATRLAPGTPRDDQIGRKATRGVAVTAGGFWAKTVIQTVATVVLARLLDPGDFGLIAMVMAIVGVADLIRDFGLTGAIIQAKEIGARLWSSLLWLSVALGVAFTIIVAALAPLIARLYSEDRLVVLTLAIAPTLLVNSVSMPLQAKLQRDLRFGELASIDVVAMVVGVAGAILSALAGWGVWSLVVLAGAGQVYRFVALWLAARPRFGSPRVDREVRGLVTTGGSIFGVQLLNYAVKNLDNVFIGQQLGAASLGQYSRAYALFLLPLQQLTGPLGRVALPVLSRLQDDGERYRRYIRTSLMIIGYLTIPTYAVAAAVSQPLVHVLLGPGWEEAAAIFALLAIAGVAQSLGNVLGWIYISLGRAHRQLVFYTCTRPLLIVGFLVGLWWNGTYGLALVYGATMLLLLVPAFAIAINGTFVTARDVSAPVARPVILAPLAFGAAWVGAHAWTLPNVAQLILGVAFGLGAMLLTVAIPAYRRDGRQIVAHIRRARRPETEPTTVEGA